MTGARLLRYVLWRLLQAIPLLFIISIILFVLMVNIYGFIHYIDNYRDYFIF